MGKCGQLASTIFDLLLSSLVSSWRLAGFYTLGVMGYISTNLVTLPPVTTAIAQSNRHEVNPALALKLLRDIEKSIRVWQQELRQVIQKIETLYAEGPMVDGWLESSLSESPSDASSRGCTETTLLRHGDAEALLQYVDALESQTIRTLSNSYASQGNSSGNSSGNIAGCVDRAQYRLCWLCGEGKVRSQFCPPEQMAFVSTAIARHQKYKQLLAHKLQLEARLQSAVEDLTGVRNRAE